MTVIDHIPDLLQPVKPIAPSQEPMLDRIRSARADLETAVARLGSHNPSIGGPQPPVTAEVLALAREAAAHLDEALRLDAPTDAVAETRFALTWLRKHIEAVSTPRPGLGPVTPDPLQFQDTIARLREVERQLDQRGFIGPGGGSFA